MPVHDVEKEAKEILSELGHSFSSKSVRLIAVFLIKVLKSLFRRIYVNEEGIQEVHLCFL